MIQHIHEIISTINILWLNVNDKTDLVVVHNRGGTLFPNCI